MISFLLMGFISGSFMGFIMGFISGSFMGSMGFQICMAIISIMSGLAAMTAFISGSFMGFISMAAFIGMMVQELDITFPGSLDLKGEVPFSSVLDNGMGFPALSAVPTFGLVQILLFGGIAETVAMPAGQYTGGPQDLPGGYDGSPGTIPGGYPGQIEDPEARDRALNVEIQNGRAAMLGVTGCMMHSCLDSCDHHFFYPITHNYVLYSLVVSESATKTP